MALRAAALFYDRSGRILLVRAATGDGWAVPSGAIDEDEDSWEAARFVLRQLGYDGLALRQIGEKGETEYWLVAARGRSYDATGDFFDLPDLPDLTNPDEGEMIAEGAGEN